MIETPLIRSKKLEKRFGAKAVYLKNETVNPTGSHKDRESEVVIEDAIKKGFNAVACASTGNAGISLAAFAYAAGLECHIFLPKSVSEEKLNLIRAFLPKIHLVDGNLVKAAEECRKFCSKKIYNANAGVCKAKLVGNSNIGEEISKLMPTAVVCPTNNGTHVIGVWLGLKKNGIKPRMIAAISRNTNLAMSIAGFSKLEGISLDECIRESDGEVIEVSDPEIISAMKLLSREKIFCEPSAAASVAALEKIELKSNDVVVCTITGNGLKYPKILWESLKQ